MSEKEETVEVSNGSQVEVDALDQEHPSETLKTSIEDTDEPVPHLHAKTYLTVFAVCLVYFAQVYNLVGAGAVSLNHLLHGRRIKLIITVRPRHCCCYRRLFEDCLAILLSCHSHRGSQPTCFSSS
jgi:hypothetical protein